MVTRVGRHDEAIQGLAMTLERSPMLYPIATGHHWLDPIREDPRFQELAQRGGLR
ncbi:MAG: hypothetical protein HKO98_04255 [Gemmatimonadetes bacterium]|nr:hypothetical protein [Gemmatimonadota bacterium]